MGTQKIKQLDLFKYTNLHQDEECFVNTHIGRISTSSLGLTLVHEHVFNRFPPGKDSTSTNFTINQLLSVKRQGIDTIVDLTPYTNLEKYQAIFEQNDINLICCIGFYTERFVPPSYRTLSVDELTNRLSSRIEKGLGVTRIKPGILKIAGQRAIMTPLEKRLFAVIGNLHLKYKLPIATHSPSGATAHLDELLKLGADPEHIFLSHLDRSLTNEKNITNKKMEILYVLGKGASVLFSEFGNGILTINKRLEHLANILLDIKRRGYINQVFISADCNWRWRRGQIVVRDSHTSIIPRTYSYVFSVIVPFLNHIGYSEQDIQTVLRFNPKSFFEFR